MKKHKPAGNFLDSIVESVAKTLFLLAGGDRAVCFGGKFHLAVTVRAIQSRIPHLTLAITFMD